MFNSPSNSSSFSDDIEIPIELYESMCFSNKKDVFLTAYVFLIAIGIDANGLFLLAFIVVESENNESWL